jgi:hypothetical protein
MASTVEERSHPGPAPALIDRTGRRGAVGSWTASALRDLLYAGAVFVWSIVAFTVVVMGVSVTLSLLVFVVGVFVWVGFACVMRWATCARGCAKAHAALAPRLLGRSAHTYFQAEHQRGDDHGDSR